MCSSSVTNWSFPPTAQSSAAASPRHPPFLRDLLRFPSVFLLPTKMPKGWDVGRRVFLSVSAAPSPASPLSTCWRRFQFCSDGRCGAGLIRSPATRWGGLLGSLAPAGTTERFIKGLLNCLTLRLCFFFFNIQDLAKKLREGWGEGAAVPWSLTPARPSVDWAGLNFCSSPSQDCR